MKKEKEVKNTDSDVKPPYIEPENWYAEYFGGQADLSKSRIKYYRHKFNKWCQAHPEGSKSAANWIFLCLIGPIICTIIAEILSCSYVYQLDRGYFFGNYMIYLILSMVLWILIRKTRVATTVAVVFTTAVSIANHFVYEFTGIGITLANLLSAGTAAEVAGAYTYDIDAFIVAAVIIAALYLFVLFRFIPKDPLKVGFTHRRKVFLILITVTVVGSIAYACCPLWKGIPNHTWRPAYHYTHHGFAMCLANDIAHGVSLDAPDYDVDTLSSTDGETGETTVNVGKGYTYESEASEDETQQTATVSTETPNVIVVMNESFSDLTTYLDGYDTTEDPMPYVRSLMQRDDVVSGTCAVSVGPGTGTANSEFEFLTGNSMEFFTGNTPYVQFITKETPSLASVMSNRGYNTLAMHAYKKAGYNRTMVYDLFGFDDYMGIEDFTVPITIPREDYPDDKTDYAQLIRTFKKNAKESDTPQFIFNITMQNHGGYYETDYDWPTVITQTEPTERSWDDSVLTYESSLHMADAEVKTLINYFESIDEPTIILFFGDHEPRLSNEFYDSGNWKAKTSDSEDETTDNGTTTVSSESLQMTADLHKTPYFIWNNYGLDVSEFKSDDANSLISLNYLSTLLFQVAGFDLTEYQTYLSDLREDYPVISSYYYTDTDGHMTSVDSENLPKAIKEYQWLQYNNIFESEGKRLTNFFD